MLTEQAVAKHGNVVMGVNMRLADESDLAGVELRFPDGRAWAGTGLPAMWGSRGPCREGCRFASLGGLAEAEPFGGHYLQGAP